MSPNSPPSPSRAPSSVASFSSESPFRRRFDRQTRREAWEKRLKKSPTGKKDEDENDGCVDASTDNTTGGDMPRTENSDNDILGPPRVSLTTSLMDRTTDDEKKTLICRTATDATASSSEQAPRGYSELNSTESDQTTTKHIATDFVGEADHAESLVKTGPQHLEHRDSSDGGERFYRVVYKGVVALVTRPASQSARSGAYVSYGEFVSSYYETEVEELESLASSSQSGSKPHFLRSPNSSDNGLCISPDSPPTSVMSQGAGSVSSLDTLKTTSSTGVQRSQYPTKGQVSVIKRAIRVDRVLTGGYAVDAMERKKPAEGSKTPKRSNAHYLPLIGPSPLPLVRDHSDTSRGTEDRTCKAQPDVLGYIFDYKKNIPLVEPCQSPPQIESGSFVYQIVSSTPLPILTGPCIDAPMTRAMVLPGTTHEVCLRMTVDDGGISFLRLSHRRGWITDRKVSMGGENLKISVVPAVREVTPQAGSVADESSVSGLSLASSSVLSTPGSSTRRRHRPPRRRRQVPTETVEAQLRQVVARTPADPFRTPTKSRFPPFSEARKNPTSPAVPIQAARSKVLSPSSNVSLLSEEDYSVDSGRNAASTSAVQTPEGQSLRPVEEASIPSYFLMRVNAPRGLKILDAPHFQVSNLIRGTASSSTTPSSSPAVRPDGSNAKTPGGHSIFQTMGTGTMTMASATKSASAVVFDSVKRSRVLPRGTLFEASKRLEASSSFTEGEGLVKLSDGSGWAIVPKKRELDFQYRNYLGGVANVREGEATRAYEEVGNAVVRVEIAGEPSKLENVWFRVLARNGVSVECPPHASLPLVDGDQSPATTSSLAGSSTSGGGGSASTSEVASSVGSSFLDAMFRTPRKRDGEVRVHETAKGLSSSSVNSSNTIPCGMSVKVDRWDDETKSNDNTFVSQDYVRLCGGQGWIPRSIAGKAVLEEVAKPDLRFGSLWFRVVLRQGIKVRLGPSRRASSIKSEDGVYFRFECGEFLRASEVVTSFDDVGVPSECFAKLYRNRHVRMNEGQMEHRLLTSYTATAEWVQVFGDNRLCLEECVDEPKIKRHKDGWRFNVVVESGVMVRRGPSFQAESTGITLLPGESILVIEQVAPPAESMLWLRLKDGQGWVHDLDKNGVRLMVAHSLRHRVKAAMSEASRAEEKEGTEIAYNAIVARLFTQNGGLATESDQCTDEEMQKHGS